jgi:hypothetical protein
MRLVFSSSQTDIEHQTTNVVCCRPNLKMPVVSDNFIRIAKSSIVLLCTLDHIFLPWDKQTLDLIHTGNWQGLALFLVIEQSLILGTRQLHWVPIIAEMLLAVLAQIYVQLRSAPSVVDGRAEKLHLSTVLSMVLNAMNNAGTVVLASDISRTIIFSRDLYLKVLGLGTYTAVVVFNDKLEEIPLLTRFMTLRKSDFTVLISFLFTRLLIGSSIQSIVMAITAQWDLRMDFQRVGIRSFDLKRLIPELKSGEENLVKAAGNLSFIMLGLLGTVMIIRRCF